MAKTPTKIHLRLHPRQVRPFGMDGANMQDLALLGLQFPADRLASLMDAYGPRARGYSMDGLPAGPAPVTLGSAGVPVQFLQHFLPGTIYAVTAARKIDDIIGRSIAGNWHDEEIVQPIVELTGRARPYGDYSPGPLANYNTTFEGRTIVRFETDFEVKVLEEERAAEIRMNSGELKRSAASTALMIEHNRVGFYGYNDGDGRTYGFLNDPNLPNYQSVPAGLGGTMWKDKTFKEITGDLRMAASALRDGSSGLVQPDKNSCTLALPDSVVDYLNVSNEQGSKTVKEWLKDNYPNWTIESAPELNNANGGQNVFYLYANEVPGPGDGGTQKVVEQYVPTVLRLLGSERRAKGIYEAYSSATAGTMWRQPFAVRRFTGL